jgi:hypothetical protein
MKYFSQIGGFAGMLVCAVSLSACLLKPSTFQQPVANDSGINSATNECLAQIETNPAQQIEVLAGHVFCIVLPSNVTTGYAWEYLPSMDSSRVKLIDPRVLC